MENRAKKIDEFRAELLEEKKKIQECQASRGFDSCFNCEHIIGCKDRLSYVNTVYKSMNKGEYGEFEF